MSILYLVRHAHTQVSSLPVETWPLSELGLQQARQLAEFPFWPEVHLICSSVEPKAMQTAQIAAERHNLPIEPVFDLREVRRSRRLMGEEEYRATVREALDNPAKSVNGWEPMGEAQTRLVVAIERLLQLHEGETLAVVSHGLALTLYQARLLGVAPTFDLWTRLPFAAALQVDLLTNQIAARFAP